MGIGIFWVLYFVYLTRNIGASPPQPLEPGSAQEELLKLGQLLVARFFNETLEELMDLLTCCLFAGWSDLWVGGVCENPFFRRVFVRISWTQNGKTISWYLELDDKFDVRRFLGYFPILKATADTEVWKVHRIRFSGGNGGYLEVEKGP